MKPKKVKHTVSTDYPSMVDYTRHRSDVLRRVAKTAGLAAVAGFGMISSALAGEKAPAQKDLKPHKLKGEVPAVQPVQLRGDVVAPKPAIKGKVKAPADPKSPKDPKPCKVEPLNEKQVAEAEQLIVQLGDEAFKVRETASDKLFKMGPAVLPVLERHKDAEDAEVRTRVAGLIEKLNDTGKEKPKVIKIQRPQVMGLMVAPQPVQKKPVQKKVEKVEKVEKK